MSDFIIEYYPITERYYPKYKGEYMFQDSSTGIIKCESFGMDFALYRSTEEQADRLIAKFKEQQLKENVIIIQK